MLRKIYSIVALVCFSTFAFAQTGTLKGVISDLMTGEPIPFANIYLEQTKSGVSSDVDGNYMIKDLPPGIYSVTCSFVGYESKSIAEVIVNPNKPTNLDIQLTESSTSLKEVEITASQRKLLLQKCV